MVISGVPVSFRYSPGATLTSSTLPLIGARTWMTCRELLEA